MLWGHESRREEIIIRTYRVELTKISSTGAYDKAGILDLKLTGFSGSRLAVPWHKLDRAELDDCKAGLTRRCCSDILTWKASVSKP